MICSINKPHSDSDPQPAAPASADAEQAARVLDRLAEMAMERASPWWPEEGPEQCRYFYFKGSQKTSPGWIDLFTEKRLDRPPWELKRRGR